MIYVYGICDGRPGRLRGDGGWGGRPLRALGCGPIAAVYSPDAPADIAPTEEALWHHENVLEELMADRAVLPLRFGSVLADEAALGEMLRDRAAEFFPALGRVRGRVEMGVRASVDAGEPPSLPSSGSDYIAGKLARRRTAAALGEAIEHEVGPLARARTARVIGDPEPMFAGAYLIDRADVDGFRKRCERARAAQPGTVLACTGPWPPYSFARPEENTG